MPTRYSLFLLALAVWCVLGTVARAQDRIVTMEGEQISCRVLLQDSLSVVYMLHHKGAKSEVMPRYRVYRVDINLPEEMHWVKRHLKESQNNRLERMRGFRLSAGGGLGVLLLPVVGDRSYDGSRTMSYHIKAEGTWFFGRFFGIGARYSMFKLHVMNVHYVGIAPTLRVPIRKGKAFFLLSGSGGYAQKSITRSGRTSGYLDTFGGTVMAGFDVCIVPKFYIGLSGEFLAAVVESEYSGYYYPGYRTYENLSRVDATVSFSYYF